MKFKGLQSLVLVAVALTAGTAAADVPPPDGAVETCTVGAYQDAGISCVSCNANFSNVTACQTTWEPQGYTKKCKSWGASVWNEIWCGPPSDAATEAGQPHEAGTDAAGQDGSVEAGLDGSSPSEAGLDGSKPSEAGAGGSAGKGGQVNQGGSSGKGGQASGGGVPKGGSSGIAVGGSAGSQPPPDDGGCSATGSRSGGIASGLVMLAFAALGLRRRRQTL